MSSSGKNIIVILGIITIVFAGYYLMTQNGQTGFIRDSESERQLANLLRDVDEFVGYGSTLNKTRLDTSIFDNDTFVRLQDFSPEPDIFQVGRDNPFLDTLPEQPLQTSQTASTQSISSSDSDDS